MSTPARANRNYRLADAEVAHALEALALVAERNDHDRAGASPERQRLRQARRRDGLMAGQLGVALFDALQGGGRIKARASGCELSEAGRLRRAG